MYLFTADLHFGNNNIIEREDRPFADIREFEDTFVSNVNAVGGADDTLYVLGDWVNVNDKFQADWRTVFAPVTRIRPRVLLVIGNNEQRMIDSSFGGDFSAFSRHAISCGIADVISEDYVSFGGRNFFLNHFPVNHKDGYVNLFGHTHRATGLWKPYGLNVGVDLNHFRPFTEEQILRLLARKEEYWDHDKDNHCMS